MVSCIICAFNHVFVTCQNKKKTLVCKKKWKNSEKIIKTHKVFVGNKLRNNLLVSFPVPRSALRPAEATGHQLPPPVSGGGLGV